LPGSSRISSRGRRTRGGQAQPLAHAQGVRLDRAAVDARQADPLQRVVDPPSPGPPVAARAGRVEQLQVRPPGQVRVGGRPFHQRADVPQDPACVPGHPAAHHLDLAAGREDQPEQHADQGGLAGPVGPEQAVTVTLTDVDVDGTDRCDAAVPLGQ